jgi:hypothetical protein
MNAQMAAAVLNALRTGLQLIHPAEDNAVMAKWRKEIEAAVTVQEAFYANLQRNGEFEPIDANGNRYSENQSIPVKEPK